MRSILRSAIYLWVVPVIAVSRMMIFFKLCGLNNDLQRCIYAVDVAPSIPRRFVATLIAAEDHRSSLHPGVDPISILRVLLLWMRTGQIQGASTIEQQFARVVLRCYERTLLRKLREQLVAVALSRSRSKMQIAMAYLGCAFYGSDSYGISALVDACKPTLETTSQNSISHMVAKLKYPEPFAPTGEWHQKIANRRQYISERLKGFPAYLNVNEESL